MQSNKKYWEKLAPSYDEGIGEEGDMRHRLAINPIVFKFLGDLNNKTILDAGCGNAYLARKMAKTAKKVIGVDFTEILIQAAKKRTPNSTNVEFKVESIDKLNFPDKVFDKILCNMVLMDVENLSDSVEELSRILKTGGVFVISVLHPCFEFSPYTDSLRNKKGEIIGRNITNYFKRGLMINKNQVDQMYHHTLQDYLNAFSSANLFVEKTTEPNNEEILHDGERIHTPMFLIWKLRKL